MSENTEKAPEQAAKPAMKKGMTRGRIVTAMLAAYHGADADMNCLSCHEAKIDEQVTEGMSWISGNYNFDSDTQMLESRSGELPTAEFCLKSGCHDGINTVDDLTAATADREFNPHDWSQHGVVACGNCHKAHETSEFYCTQCPPGRHVLQRAERLERRHRRHHLQGERRPAGRAVSKR